MFTGCLAVVLHAHLPYVRHPEHARHLEERWFYEALIECYLPLVDMFDRLAAEEIPFALTMSLTPPLAAMLTDDLLCRRFEDHLGRLRDLVEREGERAGLDPRIGPVIDFYRDHLTMVLGTWKRHGGRVVEALVRHWDAGRIELLACSATHVYGPGMLPAREGLGPQLSLGMRAFESLVGRKARGAWLAECAYHPAFDRDLAEAGVKYTVLDTHGLTNADPRPPYGVHAPVVSPSGVAFFGRDPESSRVVWSRHEGYPGDVYYRDFYRDIGFDLPESELYGEVGPYGARLMTGLKYYRITGETAHKEPYMPGEAKSRAWEHAGHFVAGRKAQIAHLAAHMPHEPVVLAPYDAELFGHWWFEGPWFLEGVFRRLAAEGAGVVEAVTLGGYLARQPFAVMSTPAASSWGAGGYGEVWVGPEAAWTWRHVHHATRWAARLVRDNRSVNGYRGLALDQLVRELLLVQSSDWAFILKTGTATGYAEARIRAHTRRLRHLGYLVEKAVWEPEDVAFVDDVSSRDAFLARLPARELRGAFV